MEIYIVVRLGVYMQGIFGVYSSLKLAKEAKVKAKELEPDDYHNFYIMQYTLDNNEEISKESDYHDK